MNSGEKAHTAVPKPERGKGKGQRTLSQFAVAGDRERGARFCADNKLGTPGSILLCGLPPERRSGCRGDFRSRSRGKRVDIGWKAVLPVENKFSGGGFVAI